MRGEELDKIFEGEEKRRFLEILRENGFFLELSSDERKKHLENYLDFIYERDERALRADERLFLDPRKEFRFRIDELDKAFKNRILICHNHNLLGMVFIYPLINPFRQDIFFKYDSTLGLYVPYCEPCIIQGIYDIPID